MHGNVDVYIDAYNERERSVEERPFMLSRNNEKHRVIQKFFPTLKGHLHEGSDLEVHFTDALDRARRKGWTDCVWIGSGSRKNWRPILDPPIVT